MNPIEQTIKDLRRVAQKHPAIVVAFSGGKDSLVVLDLCCSLFQVVKLFQMVVVPGLESFDVPFAQACARYKVTGLQHPHWVTAQAIRDGIYCDPSVDLDALPDVRQSDMWRYAMRTLGIDLIATGEKKSDSIVRAKRLQPESDLQPGICIRPLISWNKYHVLSYAKTHQIKVAENKDKSDGIDFSIRSLLKLYDTNRRDFDRIQRLFPYIEAVPERRRAFEPVPKVRDGRNGPKPAQESGIQPAPDQQPGS